MSKGQRTRALRSILYHAQRAQNYLQSERVQVCAQFGGEFVPVNKEIGSDLAGLSFAIRELQQVLTAETGQVF